MHCGNKIRARRTDIGMSAVELAERIGKRPPSVYVYETRPVNELRSSILKEIAMALDTTPQYLLGVVDPPEQPELDSDARKQEWRTKMFGKMVEGMFGLNNVGLFMLAQALNDLLSNKGYRVGTKLDDAQP